MIIRRLCLCFLLLFSVARYLSAQVMGFEDGIPAGFRCDGNGNLALTSLYYKEGTKCLEWNYKPGSALYIPLESPLELTSKVKQRYGITLWMYNEVPQQDSIRFEFLSSDNKIVYQFGFRLASSGWRACWIGFQHMAGSKEGKDIAGCRLVAPQRKGRVFLDRLLFPETETNDRTTPDMQMPYNNSFDFRDLWHWCRVWQWEQYEYDIPLSSALTLQEQTELKTIESRLTEMLCSSKGDMDKAVSDAYSVFQQVAIRPSGSGFVGAPLVAPDELNREKGEISWNDLETMLSGFAYDAYYNASSQAAEYYFLVWKYAIDQGFAFGSGMGTNHHYGYQVRDIYKTAWLMREVIWQNRDKDQILSALVFWSALQETRKPCQYGRDELLDSWHTLLMPKIVSALMFVDERERVRALKGLSRWLSTSLQYTPGTIGGIKVDGTTFHHGGFYPAYTTGVLATVGQFVSLTTHTDYELTVDARQVLKSAFIAMRNYSNKYEWGIGLSGRHPFGFSMGEEDVAAFAYLALSGDLSGEGREFDHHLAADYLRLCEKDTPEARYFKEQGIRSAKAPEGFWVYNYGSAGIFRRKDWMVTLKGYNTDVWGSEIYKNDNRYGRYQSYGSVQIMGQPSRRLSGYEENGWDWNRLPGTTTIHLPFDLLENPLTGTMMAHSKENFSGSSSLEGTNGMFAMKLMERNYRNFTPDFVARKSVFCFNDRLICLGTGIRNSNKNYPTETTLFQSVFRNGMSIRLGDNEMAEIGMSLEMMGDTLNPVCLKDAYGNYYYVKHGKVRAQIARQESRHEKTKEVTYGEFASAWIDHGKSPQGESYEYMIWIQPNEQDLKNISAQNTYTVLLCNDTVHAVRDAQTGITAYAAFDSVSLSDDELLLRLPAETMTMYRRVNEGIRISVCDPNLNISTKTYTTKEPSRVIVKQILLKGVWNLSCKNEKLSVKHQEGNTLLTVFCQHGQPVECELHLISDNSIN
nr:chondroitinase family polysaccharide lyase [Bacteroides ndongoniae]